MAKDDRHENKGAMVRWIFGVLEKLIGFGRLLEARREMEDIYYG